MRGSAKEGGAAPPSSMPPVSPAADKLLVDLRNRSDDVKKKAQADLRVLVEMEARQMSGEAFSLFIKKLNTCIFELVKSPDPSDKLGGIYAMDGLVDVECEESSTFITRFANYLRQILPCNDVGTMIMASKVLGHLAQVNSLSLPEWGAVLTSPTPVHSPDPDALDRDSEKGGRCAEEADWGGLDPSSMDPSMLHPYMAGLELQGWAPALCVGRRVGVGSGTPFPDPGFVPTRRDDATGKQPRAGSPP